MAKTVTILGPYPPKDFQDNTAKENPLKGVTQTQRKRNLEASDVLNIGSGTRCQHCGMLHFLWRETCGSCSKPMEYNLASVDEEARA